MVLILWSCLLLCPLAAMSGYVMPSKSGIDNSEKKTMYPGMNLSSGASEQLGICQTKSPGVV